MPGEALVEHWSFMYVPPKESEAAQSSNSAMLLVPRKLVHSVSPKYCTTAPAQLSVVEIAKGTKGDVRECKTAQTNSISTLRELDLNRVRLSNMAVVDRISPDEVRHGARRVGLGGGSEGVDHVEKASR
jgi:hypothetical protein